MGVYGMELERLSSLECMHGHKASALIRIIWSVVYSRWVIIFLKSTALR